MYDLDVPSASKMFIVDAINKNVWAYVLIVVLVLLSAFFAGTETAYSYCNRHRLKVYADDGNKRAKMALYIFERFEGTLITTLIGTNIAHILLSVIATLICVAVFGNIGSLLATILSTLVVFFLGDMLPKNIAQVNASKWCMNTSYIIYFLYILMFPISIIFRGLIAFIRLFIKQKDEDTFTEDDFSDVVEKIEEEGVLDEEESDIIQNAIDFGDTSVKEVYTKKEDIVALDIKKCNNEYVKKFISDIPYSRIPIYEGSIDNIIGILHVKNYLRALFKNKKTTVRNVMMKPYFVSPKMSIDDLFEGFKKNKTHIAIIRMRNKTLGMVTMQDILEELVGNIDEKDTSLNKEVLH